MCLIKNLEHLQNWQIYIELGCRYTSETSSHNKKASRKKKKKEDDENSTLHSLMKTLPVTITFTLVLKCPWQHDAILGTGYKKYPKDP